MSKGTTPIGTHSSLNIINKTPQKKIYHYQNSSNYIKNDLKTWRRVPIYNEDYSIENIIYNYIT